MTTQTNTENYLEQFALSLTVRNQPGTLTRLSALFTQRDFNINAFSCDTPFDSAESVLFIKATGDLRKRDQLLKQMSKLYDVKAIELLPC